MNEAQKTLMNRLYKEFNLTADHIHTHKHYKIINRAGIEKIQAGCGIKITYIPITVEKDFAAIKAIATLPNGTSIETFGSAFSGNATNNYYLEMAEKRAKSRAVLTLTGLYQEDVKGEDESEEFSKHQSVEVKLKPYAKPEQVKA